MGGLIAVSWKILVLIVTNKRFYLHGVFQNIPCHNDFLIKLRNLDVYYYISAFYFVIVFMFQVLKEML